MAVSGVCKGAGYKDNGAGGTPIEPPCCSWNDSDVIFSGMYDRDYEYSEQEEKWLREEIERKEQERKIEEHKRDIERYENIVYDITGEKYKHIELRCRGSICHDWLCPYCHTWISVGSEHWHNGIGEAWCGNCKRTMVFCGELEEELKGE